MTAILVRGANVPLRDSGGRDVQALVLGVGWGGASVDVNLFAILCGRDRRVRGDGDFLFWGQTIAREDSAFVLDVGTRSGPSPDQGQVVIDLGAVGDDVHYIHVVVATLEDGGTLKSLGGLQARAVDAHTGEILAMYDNPGGYNIESCVVIWEVYRRQGQWKLRAVDQGWRDGMSALANTYGVEVT
jgi:stress response protein SCP2